MMDAIRVKIVKADEPTYWYSDLIGYSFTVYKNRRDYILKEDYDRGYEAWWRHIAFGDVEILPEDDDD